MHALRVPSHDDVLQAFRKAGFPSLTPFQEKLIPLMLRGKDIIAEAAPGAGSTTALVAALSLGLRGAAPQAQAAILVPDMETVATVVQAFGRFGRALRDIPSFMPLGELEDERREQRRLEKGATVVAGTVERVIDHIRRGSLPIADLKTIVMVEPGPEARAEFVKDAQFIFTKLPERPQTILITRAAPAEGDELAALLHHPVTLDTGAAVPAAVEHIAVRVDAAPRDESTARIVLGMRLPPAVVMHAARTDARRLGQSLEARGLRVASAGARGQGERRDAALSFSRREIDILLVPWGQAVAELEDASVTHILFHDLPTAPLKPGASGLWRGARLIALAGPGQDRELTRLQEALGVAFTSREIPNDDEVLTGTIDRLLTRMKGEDQADLGRLRARIRRQVPFFLRSLFMASLLKAQLGPGGAPAAAPARQRPAPGPAQGRQQGVPPQGQRGRFGRNPAAAPAQKQPRAESRSESRVEGDFAQLFVSVGRSRRVYARDLTDLFTEKLQLSEGDIGGVRVFEKYSFVDIVPAKAQDAINRLNGTEVKGRPITVNFAKKKEEKEGK